MQARRSYSYSLPGGLPGFSYPSTFPPPNPLNLYYCFFLYFYSDTRFLFNCTFRVENPIFIEQVALHAHSHGKYVGAFVKKANGEWDRIHEGSLGVGPRHIMEPPFRIDHDFEMAVRCIYDTSSSDHPVMFGSGVDDEMCIVNFYYYSEDIDINVNQCLFGTEIDPNTLEHPLPEPVDDSGVQMTTKNNQSQYAIVGDQLSPKGLVDTTFNSSNSLVIYVGITSSLFFIIFFVNMKINK